MRTGIALLVVAAASTAGCSQDNMVELTAKAETRNAAALAKRGEYLVNIMGCHDCHTPFTLGPNGPEPDMTRALSGHPEEIGPLPRSAGEEPWIWAGAGTNTAYSGPWGVSYTANLTPDQNTGLGIWTEDMFLKAIRTGRHMGASRPILPPMPWPVYRNATDEDLKAIYAYLRTLKPRHNRVPEPFIVEEGAPQVTQ